MYRSLGASTILAIALAMPVQDAAAQDPLGGAILGGAAGAIIGLDALSVTGTLAVAITHIPRATRGELYTVWR